MEFICIFCHHLNVGRRLLEYKYIVCLDVMCEGEPGRFIFIILTYFKIFSPHIECILYLSNSVALITDISPLHDNCLIKILLYILYN